MKFQIKWIIFIFIGFLSLPVFAGTASVTAANNPIVGMIAGIKKIPDSHDYRISGWACAKGISDSIKIHIYAGGNAKNGTIVGGFLANNQSETAVAQKCQSTGVAHRFNVKLSEELIDKFAGQSIYIHGIMPTGVNGTNDLLKNSGTFKFPSRFKILWHLGPMMEDVADARSRNDLRQLDKLNSLTSGYYFLLMSAGFYSYWQGRPLKCTIGMNTKQWGDVYSITTLGTNFTLNKKCQSTSDIECLRWNQSTINTICDTEYNNYLNALLGTGETVKSKQQQLQADAATRVISNLKMRNRGHKKLINELLFSTSAFSYDTITGSLSVKNNNLDFSNQTLANNGLHSDLLMVYHEPTKQIPNGTELNTIRDLQRDESGKCLVDGCQYAGLNNNILGLIKNAFSAYQNGPSNTTQFKIPLLSTDVRVWGTTQENNFKNGYDNLSAITFEGGPLAMEQGRSLKTFATGTAYLLKNTNQDVYYLMPNSKSYEEINGPLVDGATPMINDYKKYILMLNSYLNAELGLSPEGKSVCNPRLKFIPAGYGGKIMAKTLPISTITTSGQVILANTVGGMISALDAIRTQLCNE